MKEGAERGGSLKDLGRDSTGALIGGKFLVGIVTVEARMGILRDRLYVDRHECEILRGRHGWRHVVDPNGRGGRVRYDSWRDRIDIESPDGSLQIRFRLRHTTFSWRGRTYSVTSTGWSRVTVTDEQRRTVVEARLTWSGIRLESLDPEFRPIERELALGLAQRSLAWAMAIAPVG